MNYLAHFHLAGTDEALIVGALLGDFVKGRLQGELPEGWERGIQLHRRIDALTDRHPEVAALLAQLPAGYRRYGGIMLDVCFDHCLSRHWQRFHPQPLEAFARDTYRVLEQAAPDFPAPARRLSGRLARYDVLTAMGDWRTVENMLARIGQRLSRDNPLASSGAVLNERYPDIEQSFLRFYPQLIKALTE